MCVKYKNACDFVVAIICFWLYFPRAHTYKIDVVMQKKITHVSKNDKPKHKYVNIV